MAKNTLRNRNITFTEYKLGDDFTREMILEKFPGAMTYPVVVVDGFYIGGYDSLTKYLAENHNLGNVKLLNE